MTLTTRDPLAGNVTLSQHLSMLLTADRSATVGFYDRASRSFRMEPRVTLLRRALAAAQGLTGQGLRPHEPVLVVGRSPEDMWLGYLAVVMAGGLPVVHSHRPAFDTPARARERLVAALAVLGPAAAVATTDPASLDPVAGHPALVVDSSASPASAKAAALLPRPDPDDPVHLQMTSGSTSAGRPVVVTHRALLANVAASRAAIGGEPGDAYVSWLPLYHDMGLVGTCLTSLLCDADLYLLSPFDFLRDPAAWLRGISERRGTVACSPDFGYAYAAHRLADADLTDVDLSSWRRAICGGEPVSAQSIRAFVGRFGPCGFRADAFAPSYGLAEATVYVSSWPPGAPPRRLVATRSSLARLERVEVVDEGNVPAAQAPTDPRLAELVALGPCAGVDVRLVDEDGVVVADDDRCGEIVVGGDSVTAGYLTPGGTVEAFDPSGLPTGDVGFFHRGQLYVVERLKGIVIRNGENYSTRVMEDTLAQLVDVDPGQVVVVDVDVAGGAAPLVALVELPKGREPQAVLDALAGHLDAFEPPLDELVVVRDGSLPRTTSGKKRHHEVRRALAEDGLRILLRRPLRGAPGAAAADALDLDALERDAPGAAAVDLDALERDAPGAAAVDLDALDAANRLVAIVERFAAERGSRVSVTPRAHLAHDLQLDSLALYELAVTAEEELGLEVADVDLRGLATVADLLELLERRPAAHEQGGRLRDAASRFERLPSVRRVVDAQLARRVEIGGEWYADFASCNYLGLDLHPAVIDAVLPALRTWGVHPSWSRAVASPAPYVELERALADLVGAADTVVFPTVTLLHLGVLPDLAGRRGTILLDAAAHHSLQQAATMARAQGTTVRTWRHGDLAHLARLLEAGDTGDGSNTSGAGGARVIVVDGVYSMSGELADLPALVALAEAYDAVVYVDDAHGFGILGRDPDAASPCGHGGGGVARHLAVPLDRVVYVSGLSKAFSSMAAFVACTPRHPRRRFEGASTLVFSGPVPTASLASALAGLEVNGREGDALRGRLQRLTGRLREGLVDLGFAVPEGLVPIVNVVLGGPDEVVAASDLLWDAGVLTTPSVFPAAPLDAGGVRFTVTAANDEEQVDAALVAMAKVRDTVRPTVVAS